MHLMSALQPIIILSSAIVGLLLGIFTPLRDVSINFVETFLMFLLYILFLSIDMQQLKKATLNIKYTGASVMINFIITPCIAYALGLLFFNDSMEIRIGLLMLLVTPCTDWYLVFTKLSKGNVEINMSILPLNLLLQVFLLPLYLLFFLGSSVDFEWAAILKSIVIILAIPFICAMLSRMTIMKKQSIQNFMSEHSDNLQLFFLCLAVVIMFASEGENLLENSLLLLKLFIPLLCFFVVTYFIAQIVARVLKFSRENANALQITTLARNSPLALAIAVATFPSEPLISLALVIGPLIELPILSIVSGILRKKVL